jgi:hypothetical protein
MAQQFVESKYLFGESTTIHTYTTELIKRDLTRSLQTLFPDIYAEIVAAYDGSYAFRLSSLSETDKWCAIRLPPSHRRCVLHHDKFLSFDGVLINLCSEWTAIPAHQVVMMVVARASNRVFVGLPLCRNEEYLKRCGIMYTVEAMKARATINKFPEFMKP